MLDLSGRPYFYDRKQKYVNPAWFMELERFSYDNKIVKAFMIATVTFGLIGMLVGLTAAIQLFYPIFNFETQYTTFDGELCQSCSIRTQPR